MADCECCKFFEEFFAPRDCDFDSWCDKYRKKLNDLDSEDIIFCKYFEVID